MEQEIISSLPFAPRYCWMALAAFFMVLEVIGASGVGLLFGGLAALIVGITLEIGLIAESDIISQLALWFGVTTLLAAILYKPLKRWQTTPSGGKNYDNMVGTEARVASGGLMLGKPGKVYWSGTMMNAQISPDSSKEAFLEDDMVKISDTKGNQLMVVAQNDNLEGKET